MASCTTAAASCTTAATSFWVILIPTGVGLAEMHGLGTGVVDFGSGRGLG